MQIRNVFSDLDNSNKYMISQIFELSSRFYQFIIVLQSVSLHRGNRHIHRSHCGYQQVCQHDEEVLETRR